MSNVVPFPLTASDRSQTWWVDVRLSEENWWETTVLRDGCAVAASAFSTYAEACAAGEMLQALHGFDLYVAGVVFEPTDPPAEEVPF